MLIIIPAKLIKVIITDQVLITLVIFYFYHYYFDYKYFSLYSIMNWLDFLNQYIQEFLDNNNDILTMDKLFFYLFYLNKN